MTSRKVFGRATDFYRARLLELDVPDTPLLEWRDDVLYRETDAPALDAVAATYAVELVNIDSDQTMLIASEPTRQEAERHLEQIQEDIRDLTKGEFDAKYNVVPPVA